MYITKFYKKFTAIDANFHIETMKSINFDFNKLILIIATLFAIIFRIQIDAKMILLIYDFDLLDIYLTVLQETNK